MKINLKSAKLHGTLLLGGTNLQNVLDTERRPNLQMILDTDRGWMFVKNNGFVKMIPITNVAEAEAFDSDEWEIEFPDITPKAVPFTKFGETKGAQVSTPTSHVFEKGAGKTKQ